VQCRAYTAGRVKCVSESGGCWRSFSGIVAACSYVSGAHWRRALRSLDCIMLV